MRKPLLIGLGAGLGVVLALSIPGGWFFLRVLWPGFSAARSFRHAAAVYASLGKYPSSSGAARIVKTLNIMRELGPSASDLGRAFLGANQGGTKLGGLSRSMALQRQLGRLSLRHAELLQRERMTREAYEQDAAVIHAAVAVRARSLTQPALASEWQRCHSISGTPCVAEQLASILNLSRARAEFEAQSPSQDVPTDIELMDPHMVQVLELTPILMSLAGASSSSDS